MKDLGRKSRVKFKILKFKIPLKHPVDMCVKWVFGNTGVELKGVILTAADDVPAEGVPGRPRGMPTAKVWTKEEKLEIKTKRDIRGGGKVGLERKLREHVSLGKRHVQEGRN